MPKQGGGMKKEHIERGRQDGKSDRTKPAEKTKQNYRLQIKYNSRRDFWCKEGGAKQSSPEAAAGKHLCHLTSSLLISHPPK
jgi:hypothetical protein